MIDMYFRGSSMSKIKKNERIAAITKILVENPNVIYTLDYFSKKLDTAKSTLSDDVFTIKESLSKLGLGEIISIPGARGGVKYVPIWEEKSIRDFLLKLCDELKDSKRIIPGGFIYMTDIILSPTTVSYIGEIFADRFSETDPDYIVTVETKGITPALMTARAMNKPLVIVRRNFKVTEGPSVSINYLSGSSQRIQTMSLPRRAIEKNARVLFIDDFMKAGGTAKGMMDLAMEFDSEVVGIGVLVATKEPEDKLVDDFFQLMTLNSVDIRTGNIDIVPNANFK